MVFLQTLWEADQCLILNGIAFCTGLFVPIELDEAEPQPGRRGLTRKGSVLLTEMKEHEAIATTFYTEKVHATDPARGIKAVAGEAAWGGDGFVALFDLATAKLEWIAFFDFANPFDEVELTDHAVISRNNLGRPGASRLPIRLVSPLLAQPSIPLLPNTVTDESEHRNRDCIAPPRSLCHKCYI